MKYQFSENILEFILISDQICLIGSALLKILRFKCLTMSDNEDAASGGEEEVVEEEEEEEEEESGSSDDSDDVDGDDTAVKGSDEEDSDDAYDRMHSLQAPKTKKKKRRTEGFILDEAGS